MIGQSSSLARRQTYAVSFSLSPSAHSGSGRAGRGAGALTHFACDPFSNYGILDSVGLTLTDVDKAIDAEPVAEVP